MYLNQTRLNTIDTSRVVRVAIDDVVQATTVFWASLLYRNSTWLTSFGKHAPKTAVTFVVDAWCKVDETCDIVIGSTIYTSTFPTSSEPLNKNRTLCNIHHLKSRDPTLLTILLNTYKKFINTNTSNDLLKRGRVYKQRSRTTISKVIKCNTCVFDDIKERYISHVECCNYCMISCKFGVCERPLFVRSSVWFPA